MKTALTIAGSDSSGGAGIQADLKTFAAFGIYGTCAITAVTAQNTQSIQKVFKLPADFVANQIDTVMADIKPRVWKTGMLVNTNIIDIVAQRARHYKIKSLIVDPIMVSKSGRNLLSIEARKVLIKRLIPLTFVITPNCDEVEVLTGIKIFNIHDMEKTALMIYKMGAKNIIVKGGHLGKKFEAIDILYNGKMFHKLISKRIKTQNTHGTGCTYASAITAGIAKGNTVIMAVKNAKKYIDLAISNASDLRIGHGFGPLSHFPKKDIIS
ncbi:bifunctional hydroxymethylpyrimidine kinase/phosphomethylpyrimidine kinase [Candidatus Roizmanbacteria bacterium]|nr:bifunctional hydroxymethylpyrimidine kinase/phosphomethylpyrimidine kinase [Candidatus Roizmanbacteria bacterium]